MNTLEIEAILQSELESTFVGVFAKDELLSTCSHLQSRPCALVVNTSTSNRLGVHWLALYLHKNGTGTYFDSYGGKPDMQLRHFLDEHAPRGWSRNTRKLQSVYTTTCGGFCILYLMAQHQEPNWSISTIVNKLFKHHVPWYNDVSVQRRLRKLFRIHVPLIEPAFLLKFKE